MIGKPTVRTRLATPVLASILLFKAPSRKSSSPLTADASCAVSLNVSSGPVLGVGNDREDAATVGLGGVIEVPVVVTVGEVPLTVVTEGVVPVTVVVDGAAPLTELTAGVAGPPA